MQNSHGQGLNFVAVANKWDNGRELAILPALVRGKLQDFYITLGVGPANVEEIFT